MAYTHPDLHGAYMPRGYDPFARELLSDGELLPYQRKELGMSPEAKKEAKTVPGIVCIIASALIVVAAVVMVI